MGEPEEKHDYDEYDVSGIRVFVRVDVETKNDELIIKYSKILWNEKLAVEGMIY